MRSKIAQTVCPDLPPGWSMIYNHQILKASDLLYFPLQTPDTLSSLLIKMVAGLGFEPRMAMAYETTLVTGPSPR